MFYRKLDSDYLDDTFNTIIKTLGEKNENDFTYASAQK